MVARTGTAAIEFVIDVSEGEIHSINFQRTEAATASAGDDQNWRDHQQTKRNACILGVIGLFAFFLLLNE